MELELIQVNPANCTSDEDWHLQMNGTACGYLYRVRGGFAIGIEIDGQIRYSGIELNIKRALDVAKEHLMASLYGDVVLTIIAKAKG